MKKGVVATSLVMLAITATMLTAHGGKTHDENDSTEVEAQVPSDSAQEAARLELFASINASYQTIKPILMRSCYDCHSNQTHFPWYYKIPGPKQLIDSDIKEANTHVNFSNDFPFSGHGKLGETLKAIREEIDEG
ncbi:MAG: heme-binding domain-containing protein, partial [Candidatus Zixiibacteriota bacterium]